MILTTLSFQLATSDFVTCLDEFSNLAEIISESDRVWRNRFVTLELDKLRVVAEAT